jgi:hypothetical protein
VVLKLFYVRPRYVDGDQKHPYENFETEILHVSKEAEEKLYQSRK